MTSFVDDANNYLEYNGRDVPVTKQAASVYDFKIKGDVSLNFRIPNNSHNRNSLGYNGPMDIGRVAFSKIAFNMLRNGNFFLRGYLVIQGDDGVDLDCFFLGGNANWFNALNKNIAEIDMNSLTALTTDVNARISNTSGINFPVIDWGYNGQKNSKWFQAMVNDGDAFSANYYPEFLPCVFLHSVLSEIAKDAEIQITGNVITGALFNQIIITPYKADMTWPAKFVGESKVEVTRTTNQTLLGSAVDQIELDVITYGDVTRYNTSTWAYTAYMTGIYRVDIAFTADTSQTYDFRGRLDGVSVANTTNFSGIVGTTGNAHGFVKVAKGEALSIWVQAAGGIGYDMTSCVIKIALNEKIYDEDNYFRIFARGYGSYAPVNAILKDMKGIDLIKAITTLFGAQATFNEFTQTLSIDRIDSINTYEDWSSYYQRHDINYNTGVAKNNYLSYATVSDDTIASYDSANEKNFGAGLIPVDTDLLYEKTVATLPFGPTEDIINVNLWQMPYVPLLGFEIDKTFTFTGITNNGGNANFDGTGFDGFFVNAVFFIYSATDAIYNGYHICKSANATDIVSQSLYVSSIAGYISTVKVSKKSSVNRLLLCIPSYSVPSISSIQTDYTYDDDVGGTVTPVTLPAVWFYKAPNNVTFDDTKTSLAFDDLAGLPYSNVTLGKVNFSRLKQMLKNPIIKVTFLLPEAVFKTFNFDRIIQLNTAGLQGDFYVLKVGDYMNAKTGVVVELIRI